MQDQRPLPEGYISQFDPSNNAVYFVDTRTGISTWIDPRSQPNYQNQQQQTYVAQNSSHQTYTSNQFYNQQAPYGQYPHQNHGNTDANDKSFFPPNSSLTKIAVGAVAAGVGVAGAMYMGKKLKKSKKSKKHKKGKKSKSAASSTSSDSSSSGSSDSE